MNDSRSPPNGMWATANPLQGDVMECVLELGVSLVLTFCYNIYIYIYVIRIVILFECSNCPTWTRGHGARHEEPPGHKKCLLKYCFNAPCQIQCCGKKSLHGLTRAPS